MYLIKYSIAKHITMHIYNEQIRNDDAAGNPDVGYLLRLVADLNGRNSALALAAQLMPLRSCLTERFDAGYFLRVLALADSLPHATHAIDLEFDQFTDLQCTNPLLQCLVAMNVLDPQRMVEDFHETHVGRSLL